jgi:hypothetical protein
LLVISNNSNPFGRNDPTVTVHKARPRRDQGATKARPSRDYNTLRVSKVVEDEAGDHKRIPNLLGRCQMADGVGNWSAGGAVGQLCSLSLDEGDDLTIA